MNSFVDLLFLPHIWGMNTSIERIQLTSDYSISRIIKGGWHLAGGHGKIDPTQAIADMRAFVEMGITTFDCADIYTGVEHLIGQFLSKHKAAFASGNLPAVQIHTKYVPDYNKLTSLKKEDTENIIDRSLLRLGIDRLDLVQFHWWDYSVPGYLKAAFHLMELQKAGKIRHLGLTNFDGTRVKEIVDAGVCILTHQVQYSILDQRPALDLDTIQKAANITYLCYGSLAGGFLSDKYLGAPSPPYPLENRSLTKYRLILEEFGTWEYFQAILQQLRTLADKYEVGIAEIAARFVLQSPLVAGVIIGARNQKHLEKLKQLNAFQLSPEDLVLIHQMMARANGPNGPVFGLERDKTGRHGRIMKYNLNED